MRLATLAWVVIAALCIGGGAWRPAAAPHAESAGDLFPIMPWELSAERQSFLDEPGHGIASLRACGFDTVAFVRPDQVAKAERAGLHAIVGRPADLRVKWGALSDKAIVQHVRTLVEAAGESDALIGYFLADESGVSDFAGLGKAVAAVKKLAPGKLAYVNVYPSYASPSQLGTKSYAEYLERYVAEVRPQFLSYGNFDVQYSRDFTEPARTAEYFANLLLVRRIATKHGLPFWTALVSSRIRPYTTAPSPANLRVQAYTSLAAGAHGLTWFTYYAGTYGYAPIDAAGKRTATWSYLKAVNDQVGALTPVLTRLRTSGVFFTRPQPAAGLPRLPGKLVESIRSPTPVMVGELAGGGGSYALVVNLSLKTSAKLIVKTHAGRVERISPVDGSPRPLAKDGSLWLAAGQGALLRLRSAG